jgi:hypothetical protein
VKPDVYGLTSFYAALQLFAEWSGKRQKNRLNKLAKGQDRNAGVTVLISNILNPLINPFTLRRPLTDDLLYFQTWDQQQDTHLIPVTWTTSTV